MAVHLTKSNTKYKSISDTYQIDYYPDIPIKNSGAHKHDFYEIILILGSSVSYGTDSGFYPVRPGSLILISPQTTHYPVPAFIPVPNERYVLWIHKQFLENLCTKKTDLRACFFPDRLHVLPLDALSLDQVRSSLKIIYDTEMTVTYFGKDIIQRSYLQQFLVLINSIYFDIAPAFPVAEKVQEHNTLAEEIMNYLSINFREDISLSAVAEQFHLDKYYINRKFKNYYKITIYQFVLQKRLEYSKYLIKKGMSVDDSYKLCGFNDYCNFNRLFKQHYQMTPMQYKKNLRK